MLNESQFDKALKLIHKKSLKKILTEELNKNLSTDQEEFLNKYVDGTWQVNGGGLIDVIGDVYCGNQNLTTWPVQFGVVSGSFFMPF